MDNNKIDKAADIFVALSITVLQLILAAICLTYGLTIIPMITDSWFNVLKVFVFLVGIKCVVAGYKNKQI